MISLLYTLPVLELLQILLNCNMSQCRLWLLDQVLQYQTKMCHWQSLLTWEVVIRFRCYRQQNIKI